MHIQSAAPGWDSWLQLVQKLPCQETRLCLLITYGLTWMSSVLFLCKLYSFSSHPHCNNSMVSASSQGVSVSGEWSPGQKKKG